MAPYVKENASFRTAAGMMIALLGITIWGPASHQTPVFTANRRWLLLWDTGRQFIKSALSAEDFALKIRTSRLSFSDISGPLLNLWTCRRHIYLCLSRLCEHRSSMPRHFSLMLLSKLRGTDMQLFSGRHKDTASPELQPADSSSLSGKTDLTLDFSWTLYRLMADSLSERDSVSATPLAQDGQLTGRLFLSTLS